MGTEPPCFSSGSFHAVCSITECLALIHVNTPSLIIYYGAIPFKIYFQAYCKIYTQLDGVFDRILINH